MNTFKKMMMIALIASAFGCGESVAPAASATEGGEAPAAFDAAQAMLAGFAGFNAGDDDAALAAAADDVSWGTVGNPPVQGKDAIKALWTQIRTGLPDVKLGVKRVIVAGDTVAAQYTVNGTHTGDFMGNAATGKTVGVEAMLVATVTDGKFSRFTLHENQLGLMSQIGVGQGPAVALTEAFTGDAQIVNGEANAANEATAKAWYAAFGWDACEKTYCAADAVQHEVGVGKTHTTAEDRKAGIEQWKTAFPDLKLETSTVASVGDYVIVEGAGSGTHSGPLGAIAATNKAVTGAFAEILLLQDGKVKENWNYVNQMPLLIQLGVIPAPGAAAPAAATPAAPAAAPAK